MIEIKLLACTHISDAARKELERAGCPIHPDVLWEPLANVEIVELQHAGDLQEMSVWGAPREIQVPSRALYLHYQWHISWNGFVLTLLDEETPEPTPVGELTDEQIAQIRLDDNDIDEHPF